MVAQLLAALGLLVCIGLAVRMALPDRHRYRLDAWGRRRWAALRGGWASLRGWRRRSAMNKQAAAQAEEVIRRARSGKKPEGEWDGNVYRPKNFNKDPRDKRNLH